MWDFLAKCNDFLKATGVFGGDAVVCMTQKPLQIDSIQFRPLVSSGDKMTVLCYLFGNSEELITSHLVNTIKTHANFKFKAVRLVDNPYNIKLLIETDNYAYLGLERFFLYYYWLDIENNKNVKPVLSNQQPIANEVLGIEQDGQYYYYKRGDGLISTTNKTDLEVY